MLRRWQHWLWRDGGDNNINIDGGNDNNNGGDSNSVDEVQRGTRMTMATAEAATGQRSVTAVADTYNNQLIAAVEKMAEKATAMAVARQQR